MRVIFRNLPYHSRYRRSKEGGISVVGAKRRRFELTPAGERFAGRYPDIPAEVSHGSHDEHRWMPKKILLPADMNAKKRYHGWNSDYYYNQVYTQGHGKASDCIRCGKCEKPVRSI